MVRYADPGVAEWVESNGGPLVVVPETALLSWLGSDGDGSEDDYDRACGVDSWTGLVPVGQENVLVLGGDPASTTFLPEHDLFVRWCAAESEAELLYSIGAAIGAAAWEPDLHWAVSGPVLLFDAVWSGNEITGDDHLRVALEPGCYAVRAAHVEPDPLTSLVLVQLRRLPHQ
ncbi:Imm21 family immunity protein [Kitasatospora sp. NPDC089509]|uniref:Imm21 family immunity protein n=1 Tax=Kitasatospora sp. NPDC089509 TaxID=3364079 RepID=UPI0037FBFA5B